MSILPWRMRHRGGFINTMLKVPIRRLWLSRLAARLLALGPDDITVVIGTRNQASFRLRNALRSIREQDYDASLIQIRIIDYGSEFEVGETINLLSREFCATRLRVDSSTCWNRSHALNIGIRAASTKFVLTSDVDIVFQRNYLSEVIAELRRTPLSVVYSQTWDSTEDMIDLLAGGFVDVDFRELRQKCTPRPAGHGINATFTQFYHLIRGYDEFYQVYGAEDVDLHRRFNRLGLTDRNISERSCFIHQWHPPNPGKARREAGQSVIPNLAYLSAAKGIVRNPRGWGETSGRPIMGSS